MLKFCGKKKHKEQICLFSKLFQIKSLDEWIQGFSGDKQDNVMNQHNQLDFITAS